MSAQPPQRPAITNKPAGLSSLETYIWRLVAFADVDPPPRTELQTQQLCQLLWQIAETDVAGHILIVTATTTSWVLARIECRVEYMQQCRQYPAACVKRWKTWVVKLRLLGVESE
jgi:hypothetical protein